MSKTNKLIKNYLENLILKILKELQLPYLEVRYDISVPDADFGDYATNAALIFARRLKMNPEELANQIAQKAIELDVENYFEQIYQLKNFVNFKISKKALLLNLENILQQKDRYGSLDLGKDKNVIIEYFQNNVAKPPHVGHLRSAVLGDSLLRIFRFLGFNALSDTHIGDWGTQFGILIYAFKTIGNREIIEKDPINELNKLYVAITKKIELEPELLEKGKAEFKKLEDGDKQNRELWQWFVDESVKDFEKYRKLLGVLPFDYNLGESFYENQMSAIVQDFKQKDLVTVGQTGELYVDLDKYNMGRCILVKSDGATTYHLRDFATYIYRKNNFNFYKNIYVVDSRQSHHFKQLFKVLELAGYPVLTDSIHVPFGFMSLPEGPISTRKGNIISLQNLVDEAEKRAIQIIREKNPDLENKEFVAKEVALAAIKYFDLSHNRKSEIIFEWDKALSFEGNTGPYMQYSYARIHGILRKSGLNDVTFDKTAELSLNTYEIEILRKLHQFNEILELVLKDYTPSFLCQYLFELSQNFNTFYQNVNILKETDQNLRNFRLQLIMSTAQVIKNGLYLLGISAPQEM